MGSWGERRQEFGSYYMIMQSGAYPVKVVVDANKFGSSHAIYASGHAVGR